MKNVSDVRQEKLIKFLLNSHDRLMQNGTESNRGAFMDRLEGLLFKPFCAQKVLKLNATATDVKIISPKVDMPIAWLSNWSVVCISRPHASLMSTGQCSSRSTTRWISNPWPTARHTRQLHRVSVRMCHKYVIV